ncbi:aspartate aminotransferase family protein [Sneathiella sp. P13V-1]|uniref:(R)-1-hydroxy-2-aminoethylphosphonate ammonia-lyase n=1 Tax=Sneathiella sp. P13V-1 TaxID=2697366 RepID=UPI00187B5824|nr:aspartate aminotransferase family protein [Sneathiella sp. P13V-1]MBE7637249.1 aspartate aminotransferase family protein [Sneathiella sp. P13V-1]
MAENKPHQSEGDVNFSARRKEWAAENIGPEQAALLKRDADAFMHQSVSTPCLNTIKGAEGAYIIDGNGKKYLDFHGNNVHHIGYGHPRLKEAITKQMDELPFAPRRFTCDPAVELAEKLAEISPGDLSKVLYATGGSDAIEMAMKVARAKTGRFKTVSFWDAFHGAGFGASSIGGEQLFRGQDIGPLLPGTEHVAPFACYRCPYGYECDTNGQPDLKVCKTTCANMLRYVLEKEGNVAAVIAEPARAVPYTPPKGFWKMVREACNDAGALLIFDEIPTGLGKTGEMFACNHDEVVPDILVMGKALGGGILPISAMLCRPELDILGDYAIGHYTHEKNPVTTRAALTTIQIIEDEGLVENAAKVGAYALDRMAAMKDKYSLIGDVRGRGFLLGLELVTDREAKTPANDQAEEILYRAFDAGLSFKTTMGNVLTLTPSLITTEAQMDFALDVIEDALKVVS